MLFSHIHPVFTKCSIISAYLVLSIIYLQIINFWARSLEIYFCKVSITAFPDSEFLSYLFTLIQSSFPKFILSPSICKQKSDISQLLHLLSPHRRFNCVSSTSLSLPWSLKNRWQRTRYSCILLALLIQVPRYALLRTKQNYSNGNQSSKLIQVLTQLDPKDRNLSRTIQVPNVSQAHKQIFNSTILQDFLATTFIH